MDFTKFVALLETKSLYFTRCDKFEDAFEGSYPKMNVAVREAFPFGLTREQWDKLIQENEENKERARTAPRYTAINCWHLNEHESAAMWRLYLKSNEGIAIQSSFERLRDCFCEVEEPVHIGKVTYIDYEEESIRSWDPLAPFVFKRKSFEHEREVRAVITRSPALTGCESPETIAHGINIPVNVETLVERVYVAPDAPAWLSSLVGSVAKKYGSTFEVTQSNLNQTPLF